MIALGGPTLKPAKARCAGICGQVSMIALGGPTLKLSNGAGGRIAEQSQ